MHINACRYNTKGELRALMPVGIGKTITLNQHSCNMTRKKLLD